MEYMALWFLLGIIFMITWTTKGFRLWLKMIITIYYLVLSFVFIMRKEEIYRQFHTIPVPNTFWDANSDWVSSLIGFYFLPFLLILLFTYYRWFAQTSGTAKKVGIVLSLIPSGVVFFCLLVIFSMYGYRP
ncbi:hypothetical protein [Brevibacillus choshinensis]|uniref:hypothetical protein n=1 Tax=Brevibacillus choshinensis TaxID=54911 RepID=UPI002E1FFA45|nr:hypothetical protein [Brevibacillus choshinensis]MED4751906.1 hypothetical protein [Brevibacillus choshinensis]MED4784347.1 hypothetical protein [Brevibacillus choshinensis]